MPFVTASTIACTQHSANKQTQQVPPPPSMMTGSNPKHSGLDTFYRLCLRSGDNSEDMISRASEMGFVAATDIQLASLGLAALRKTTLVIPGGGAFISETQQIMINPGQTEKLVLVVENQFAKKKHIKTECSIHASKSKHIETCATLGYMLERAPSHNTRYSQQNAHFIEWDGKADGSSMKVGCSGTTDDSDGKYTGTRLSAKYLHSPRDGTLGAKLKRIAGNSGS